MDEEKLKNYRLYKKIFETLGTLVLVDTIFLKPVGIPFVASLILYPLLNFFFKQETVLSILGIYSISWLFLFILAIILNRKIKKIEKSGVNTEPQKTL